VEQKTRPVKADRGGSCLVTGYAHTMCYGEGADLLE
jgi:hypothetical protein